MCYGIGTNFIAAFIITVLGDEEQAFWLFVCVMRRSRGMYCKGVCGLKQSLDVFTELLSQHVPKLDSHLRSQGLVPKLFAQRWFLSVFTCDNKPNVVAYMVWDSFVLGGWEIVFRAALALLAVCEKDLIQMPGDTLFRVLPNLPVNYPNFLPSKMNIDESLSPTDTDGLIVDEDKSLKHPKVRELQRVCWKLKLSTADVDRINDCPTALVGAPDG